MKVFLSVGNKITLPNWLHFSEKEPPNSQLFPTL